MIKNLINISGKISDPIVSIYALIAQIAKQNNVPFFVIGATARDIIFEYAYGIKAPRGTRDIDLAVQVASWQEFQQLKNQLIATGNFTSTKMTQRLLHKNKMPVDIVPFGAINHEGSITWPPENSIKMSVIGFQEAYETTQIVTLSENPALDVYVVTPQSLVLLKLTAWKDRCIETGQQNQYKLVEAMTHEKTRRGFEKNLALLEALYLGLNEPNENSSNS